MNKNDLKMFGKVIFYYSGVLIGVLYLSENLPQMSILMLLGIILYSLIGLYFGSKLFAESLKEQLNEEVSD